MSKLAKTLRVLGAGLLLAACTEGGITDPALSAGLRTQVETVAAAHTDGMVPIKWAYHMTPIPGTTIECTNSDGSPPFLEVAVNYSGTGTVSHLGKVDSDASTAWFTDCVVNIIGGYPVTAEGGLVAHLVGANGDAIDLEGVLTVSFADFGASGAWEITGGSGRFAGASGWLETYEVAAEDGSGSVGSGSGMITPPGILMR